MPSSPRRRVLGDASASERRARAKCGARALRLRFVEYPQEELGRRNIGKAFLSDGANIPSTLTMPTDAVKLGLVLLSELTRRPTAIAAPPLSRIRRERRQLEPVARLAPSALSVSEMSLRRLLESQSGFEEKPARHLEQQRLRTYLAGVGGQGQSKVGTRPRDELLEGQERLPANPRRRFVGQTCGFDQDQCLTLLGAQAREGREQFAVDLPGEAG